MTNAILQTSNDYTLLFLRIVAGIIIFPYGMQKLFGWFGGYGFKGTMGFLTGQAGLSYFVALLVILIESVAAIMIVAGLFTRFAALGIFGLFTIIMFKFHSANGFFMNWYKLPNKGEGLEFFILLFGLVIVTLILGGGNASVDAAISHQIKD